MTFDSTKWEYSDMTDTVEFTQPEAGDQYLLIEEAVYDPDGAHMDIRFKSLANGAGFRLRYFFLTKDGKQNGFTGKVLKSLGRAINNEDVVLAPCDIIGAVVRANVILPPAKEPGAKVYPRIDEYLPIPEEMMMYSTKADQYYETE